VSALPILFTAWPTIVSLTGDGTIIALATFVLVGLAVGHLLGGPDPEDRSVLALSTASRHPGVALAIAHATFPEQQLVLAAVLLYLLVSALVPMPYLAWNRRRHADGLPARRGADKARP
jgi:BASS family bile acid:Na+ symporter